VDPLILILLASGLLLLVGAGIAVLGGGRSDVDERMERYVGGAAAATVVDDVPLPRQDTVGDRMDKAIGERGFTKGIKSKIAKADVKLRVSEYILIRIGAGVGIGALLYFVLNLNPVFSVIAGFGGSLIPSFYLKIAAGRRLSAFDNQLSDTLNLWVNALRSGYSVLQAMEAIATELPPPVSVEFERVVQEVRLGLSVSQALGNMLRRLPSEDLDLVVTAVNIQREVGGNLAEVLDTISFTIRERVRIKGEIKTLTAQGRMSGIIISLLPIALAFALLGINPEYMSALWINAQPMVLNIPCGWIAIASGLILMAIGIYIIMRIVDIEV
jgi:tight adherence protein B